jgi:predicted phage terminase large subunit-like protein
LERIFNAIADTLKSIPADNPKAITGTLNDAWEIIRAAESLPLTRRFRDLLHNASDDTTHQTLLAEIYRLHTLSLLLHAKDDLDSYLRYIESDREPQKRFYEPRRKVLQPLVQDLQDLEDGKIDFLGISLPPRTGKSTIGCFFMTWHMGRHPQDACVMSGHSDKLTSGFYQECLSILQDAETYKYANVFPHSQVVDKSAKDEAIHLQKWKRFPTLTCRSIGGTLTGAVEVGSNGILYCDDLIEDLEESLNPLRLQSKYDAYLNQLKDRKKDGAKELMIGTRWNVADPLGRVREQYEGNPRYRFTVMPALDENQQSNFRYPFGLGFSTEYYIDMKESIDDATWEAKYMGDPYVREGLLYPKDSLRRFYDTPPGQPDGIIAVCDTKDKGKDYAFMPIVYIYNRDYYVVDCICDNGLPELVEARISDALIRHKVDAALFESNSAGGHIAKDVASAVKERGGKTTITTKFTTQNKETKIILSSGWVKERVVFFDDPPNDDYRRMMQFLTTYSMSGKNPHDDVPDGFAMLAGYVKSLGVAKVEAVDRRF